MYCFYQNLLVLLWIFTQSCLVQSKWPNDSKRGLIPKCDRKIIEKGQSGTISYEGKYPVVDYCIKFPIPDHSLITISFQAFSYGLTNKHGNCTDYVEIGSREGGSRRYCGYKHPPPSPPFKGLTWVRFHQENDNLRVNVKLNYSIVPSCSGNVTVPLYTFVTSPGYPNMVREEKRCVWKFSSDNIPLQIQLTDWSLNAGGAVIEIYDGPGLDSPLLVEFNNTRISSTGSSKSKVYTTTGPYAVLYYTNSLHGISSFNATVKVRGYCIPGTYSCGDGLECFDESQKCNGIRDCSSGYDELGCNGCSSSMFWCGGSGHSCYSQEQYCNGMKDCQTNDLDEQNCESCKSGSFLCIGENRCIYDRWKCDGDLDCHGGTDEQDCPYVASRRVITAAIIGSLVCSLLLVIALGCTCKLYSLRTSHHRHPHYYRATPLTRVEREIFQRQAPPTYDMTVSGTVTDPATQRQQRRRRRSRRRYQFQRSMPATVNSQTENNRSNEEVEILPPSSNNTTATATEPTGTQEAPPVTTSATEEAVRRSVASFVIDSVPDILAEMIFSSRNPANVLNPNAIVPPPIETRDNGTQTNPSSPRNSSSSTPRGSTSGPAPTNVTQATGTQSTSTRRQERGSRSRRRSANTNSKEQQAKPLPKKKKIQPVLVPAPYADSLVGDTLTCVYPCPPSYSQAVSNGSPVLESITPTQSEVEYPREGGGSPEIDPPSNTQDSVFTSPKATPTSSRKFPFGFSFGQALRNIATSPFSKFQKNPYSHMDNMESVSDLTRTNSQGSQGSQDALLPPPGQTRTSTSSSDEDLLVLEASSGPQEDNVGSQTPPQLDSPAPHRLVKVFPRRNNGKQRTDLKDNEDRNSLELSDISFSEET